MSARPSQLDPSAVLERLRERLLDLSARNPLLSYRHPRTRSVRVVDEIPSQVFQHLLTQGAMTFAPLDSPDSSMEDPLDDQVLPHAVEQDEDRRRRQREDQKAKRARFEAHRHVVVQRIGIEPSFDLCRMAQTAEDAHNDSRLRTLLFPHELEKLLHTLHRDSTTAIQESGANLLHLMFGFVEWQDVCVDQERKSETRLAPLVLLPVSLSRADLDLKTRMYPYRVEPTGEDWSTNVTLQVKCRKEFGFELPSIDPANDETLEAYFLRVENAIEPMLGWRFRRYVSLGLVSFGKILMWRDLDPTTWPRDTPILGNRILCQILGEGDEGGALSPGDPLVDEYPLDALPPDLGAVPPLILDADSSQHSVLIDVQNGKNLVVQGPPGTGKSQTIANLIGHALSVGKRVLFVAEKRAALDVVYNRLREAGLEPFCLALHSHSSQKREFLDDLMRRLNLRGALPAPAELRRTIVLAEEAREELNRHVVRLHAPFAALTKTPYQIFWRARRLATDLGDAVVTRLKDHRVAASTSVTALDLSRNRGLLDRYAAELSVVLSQSSDLAHHPWCGVRADALTYQDVESLLDLAHTWMDAIQVIEREAEDLHRLLDCTMPTTLNGLRHLSVTFARVTRPDDGMPATIPKAIVTTSDEPTVRGAVSAVERAREAWASVPGNWSRCGAVSSAAASEFELALLEAASTFGAITLTQAGSLAASYREIITQLDQAVRLIQSLDAALHLRLLTTPLIVERFATVVESLSSVDDVALSLRSAALDAADAADRVGALASQAVKLRAQAQGLNAKYDPALQPDPGQLQNHVAALSTAPQFLPWLLSARYRAAVSSYRAMTGERTTRNTMTKGLRSLLAHMNALSAFNRHPALPEFFGPAARGLDTPFESVSRLLKWRANTVGLCRGLGESGRALEEVLWNGRVVDLREAEGRLRSDPGGHEACKRVAASLEGAQRATGKSLESHGTELVEIRTSLENAATLLDKVCRVGESAGPTASAISVVQLREWLESVRAAWAADDALERYRPILGALGVTFHGPETDVTGVSHALEFLAGIREANVAKGIARWLIEEQPVERVRLLHDRGSRFLCRADDVARAQASFAQLSALDSASWLEVDRTGAPETELEAMDFNVLRGRIGRALASSETLNSWAAFHRRRAEVVAANLLAFCSLVEAGTIPPASIANAYEATLYRTLAEAVLRAEPSLGAFSGAAHGETRRMFSDYDERLIKYVRSRIAHDLDEAPPQQGKSYGLVADLTDEALIRREAEKTRRHIPIREVFRRAGSAILAMKPCFLMGPQAVAQYLAPGLFEFDLVVMDEASQMRPEDALGAIARSKQLVVVGDPKQLGPTQFFDRIQDEEEDLDVALAVPTESSEEAEHTAEPESPPSQGASVLERSESILHAAAARYPTRLLRWHYRSKHPKLIAFSSREFYGENLILFPTPRQTEDVDGVFFRRVANGIYQPRGRRNLPEAQAVLEAVRQHARIHPERSLMIATLNAVQAELIDLMIEQAEKEDPELQAFRSRHGDTLEPFAVKNLENVQGDERDVIMVSLTFGRTDDRKFSQNFGPINSRGGERRLNVLFTRAKHRLDVFSSFDPAELRVAPDSPRGLQVLKEYLLYAQGTDWARGLETGRPPDSDFEIAVASALEMRGFTLRCQIGVAGFFIDLGVVHPDYPGRFILGVECDGATYHSSKSARDRDRLREKVLTREFGWKLHRVWSTDWFRNPVRETDGIVQTIERLMEEEKGDPRAAAA